MNAIKKVFESVLWDSRFIVIAAVLSSLAISLAMFFIATADAVILVSHLGDYISSEISADERATLRATTIAHAVGIVDGYLLATILLIFSLGLYELFISPIKKAEQTENACNVLLIHSLDDLKDRLAKVILMILIVMFFEHAVAMTFGTALELLYLAGGIALIGLALYLSHAGDTSNSKG